MNSINTPTQIPIPNTVYIYVGIHDELRIVVGNIADLVGSFKCRLKKIPLLPERRDD